MKEYVAGFMRDEQGRIALVRKNKPAWQAGRLNGIGGGIEAGETPLMAMRREWYEETSTFHHDWRGVATIIFDYATVYFFKASVASLPWMPPHNDIGERIEWHNYSTIVRATDMIPNLKWLLPLAFEDPDATYVMAGNDNGPTRLATVNEVRAENGLGPISAGNALVRVAA